LGWYISASTGLELVQFETCTVFTFILNYYDMILIKLYHKFYIYICRKDRVARKDPKERTLNVGPGGDGIWIHWYQTQCILSCIAEIMLVLATKRLVSRIIDRPAGILARRCTINLLYIYNIYRERELLCPFFFSFFSFVSDGHISSIVAMKIQKLPLSILHTVWLMLFCCSI
jgi:hypothetical protein